MWKKSLILRELISLSTMHGWESSVFWQISVFSKNPKFQKFLKKPAFRYVRVSQLFRLFCWPCILIRVRCTSTKLACKIASRGLGWLCCMLQSKPFWILVRAIHDFVQNEGKGRKPTPGTTVGPFYYFVAILMAILNISKQKHLVTYSLSEMESLTPKTYPYTPNHWPSCSKTRYLAILRYKWYIITQFPPLLPGYYKFTLNFVPTLIFMFFYAFSKRA